jgi:hypothetical protein
MLDPEVGHQAVLTNLLHTDGTSAIHMRRDAHGERRQANSEDCCSMIPRGPLSGVVNK